MRAPLPRLPIDEALPRLVGALSTGPCAVLRAPTGAGKTTRVPPALLDAGLAGDGSVVMLEPRRLAARAAARRIAFERGVELGGEIGYQVRFDRRASRATRLLVVTEGILVRMLQDDPFLEGVGALVFDEFHERSLDGDFSLAMARKVQREARSDLKLLAMSATIVPEALARFLGGCPVIESDARAWPVDVSWLERDEDLPVHRLVARGVERALAAPAAGLAASAGDVLAFLPGVGEIRRTRAEIEALPLARGVDVVELYGDLPPEEQDRALRRGERRRVVLATNVAQTSVTVDGVSAVVDSGLARTLRYDPGAGLDRLELGRISRAAAEQRAGRAGRTGPGRCLRLWTRAEERSLAEEDEPEIRRVDLSAAVLQLACWGEREPGAFPWLEAPSPAAIARALELLNLLGALEGAAATDLGREMARLPVHPRLARLLIEGARLGRARTAALAAALLSERDPFPRGERGRGRDLGAGECDVLDRVRALEEFEDHGRTRTALGELEAGAARRVLAVRDQLLRVAAGVPIGALSAAHSEALRRAILAAYPDRIARRREPKSRRGVLVEGRGVVLAEESAVRDEEYFTCVDLDLGRRGERAEALVRLASGVRAEWIDPARFRTTTEVGFDEARERVVAVRRTRLGAIVAQEAEVALPPGEDSSRALLDAASTRLERALALDEPDTAAFLARVRSLREWMPELSLPAFGEAELRAVLAELCAGRSSFAELRSVPLADFLRRRLTRPQVQALEREAPERIAVPSGSRIAVRYEPGRPPLLAVRIQELFGLADTPRVAAGRVKVLLHLLGPNHRPEQVTDDLASFWRNTYPEVRKELRRRYPRHAWPEDPLRARPERRPQRRA